MTTYDYFIGPSGVFPTPLAAAAFTLVLVGYMLLESRYRVRPQAAKRREGKGSFQLHFLAVPASLLLPLICGFLQLGTIRGDAREPLVWLGLAAMLGGRLFRLWAQLHMGRLFVGEVAIQHGHRVVQSGPYRRVRHPAYTGGTVSAIGIGLALSTWLGAALAGAVLVAAYAVRIPKEEALLVNEFGDEYRAYMARTKRFVPFVF